MKWFKFESSEIDDPIHQEIISEFGIAGFGVYAGIRCLIAGRMSAGNCEPKIDICEKVLARKLRIRSANVAQILGKYAAFGKLFFTLEKQRFTIEMRNLLSALDEWTLRSGATRELLGKEENRGEQNRGGGKGGNSISGVTREFVPSTPPPKNQKKGRKKIGLSDALFSTLSESQKIGIVEKYPPEFLSDRLPAYVESAEVKQIKTMRPSTVLKMLAEDFDQFQKERNRKAREKSEKPYQPPKPEDCAPPPPEWKETKNKIKRGAHA